MGGSLLVLDGSLPDGDSLLAFCSGHSPIVAADGGALRLRDRGVAPDVIVGDLDTVGGMLDDHFFEGAEVVHLPEQNEFDGAKGLQWIGSHGNNRVTVLGASGGMTDHVLNNFSMLARFAGRLRITVADGSSTGYLVTTNIALDADPGDRVSILPLPSARLDTKGLEWNLHDALLSIGGTTSVSNRALDSKVILHVAEGTVVLFHYPT